MRKSDSQIICEFESLSFVFLFCNWFDILCCAGRVLKVSARKFRPRWSSSSPRCRRNSSLSSVSLFSILKTFLMGCYYITFLIYWHQSSGSWAACHLFCFSDFVCLWRVKMSRLTNGGGERPVESSNPDIIKYLTKYNRQPGNLSLIIKTKKQKQTNKTTKIFSNSWNNLLKCLRFFRGNLINIYFFFKSNNKIKR